MRGWEEPITGIRECSCDECHVLNGTVQSLLLDCVVTNWNSDKNLKKKKTDDNVSSLGDPRTGAGKLVWGEKAVCDVTGWLLPEKLLYCPKPPT